MYRQHIGIGDTEIVVETLVPVEESANQTQILDPRSAEPDSFSEKQTGASSRLWIGRSLRTGFLRRQQPRRRPPQTGLGLEADRGAILIQEEDQWLCRTAWSRIGVPLQGFVLSQTILSELLRSRRAVLSKDTSSDPRFEDRRSVTGDEIRSVIAAPIFIEKSLRGILYLDRIDGESHPLGEAELWASGTAAATMGAGLSLNAELDELHQEKVDLVQSVLDTHPIIGSSPAVEEVRKFIQKVAPTSGTVLIISETGTGKELAPRPSLSGNRLHAFVTINCDHPDHLVESELFGTKGCIHRG